MYYLKGKECIPIENPDDVLQWAKAFEQNNRILQQDTIGDVFVSTVFLGLDHQYDEGPPLLFETMTFKNGSSKDMKRYSTYDEAILGHRETLKKLTENL